MAIAAIGTLSGTIADRLSRREGRQCRAGRDAALAELARLVGGSVAVVRAMSLVSLSALAVPSGAPTTARGVSMAPAPYLAKI
jgi:hypothetical protein